MSLIYEKLLTKIYILYIELVCKTSTITFPNNNIQFNNSIIGFWHGDSFSMNMLLREKYKDKGNIKVVVTKSKRGNFIESIIEKYNGETLRMPDGIEMKKYLRRLKDESVKENISIVIALDGPLGPYKEPKKLGPTLSKEGKKDFVVLDVKYSKSISLKSRWDKYSIPLPFTKIEFIAYNFGIVSEDNLKKYKDYKEIIKSLR